MYDGLLVTTFGAIFVRHCCTILSVGLWVWVWGQQVFEFRRFLEAFGGTLAYFKVEVK